MFGPPLRPNLWRLEPISREFGFNRGQPVDRYYIEQFLAREAEAIRGHVLEIGHDIYTRKFGGARVEHSDVLYRVPGLSTATIVADLADAPQIPSATFDCIILIHTLQYIFDVHAAVRTLHRILKPGGTALIVVPFIEQYSPNDRACWGEYWRISKMGLERMLGDVFGPANVSVRGYGNVLATTAFLQGIAAEELSAAERSLYDADYDLIVTAKAIRVAQ